MASFIETLKTALAPTVAAVSSTTGLPAWAVLLGLGYVAHRSMGVMHFIVRFFARPSVDVTRAGKWAVVTGATDGIGRAMAKELAHKGLSVLLVSRSADKLKATAQEIQEKYPKIETKTLAVDFDLDKESKRWSKLSDAVKDLESKGGVAVLVNNVGISYNCAEYFLTLSKDQIDQMIRMNVTSTAWMCKIAMPDMVERKSGYVINIASAASIQPTTLLSLYSATKADVQFLSRSLDLEYAPKGVRVQTFIPFFVASKLSKQRPSWPLVPTADAYARSACAMIGYEPVTTGWWLHELVMKVQLTFPWAFGKYSEMVHFDLRKRFQRKQARLAKDAQKNN